MLDQLRFVDHGVFHRHVALASGVGAGLGLGALVIEQFFRSTSFHSAVGALGLGAVVAALGFVAAPPRGRRWLVLALGLGAGVIGALLLGLMVASPPVYPWFGVALWGAVYGAIVSRDLQDSRRWLLPLATGCSVVLASWVCLTLSARVAWAEYMPAVVAFPLKGALFGFIASMALAVQQLRLAKDPVQRRYEEVKATLSGELGDLAGSSMATYGHIAEVFADRRNRGAAADPELLAAVEQLVLRILELGVQWQQVERESCRSDAAALSDRIAALGEKIEASSDRVARSQYLQAKKALEAQLRYLNEIATSRERVLARVHNYAATLERVNLAVVNSRGADAATFSSDLAPLIEEIEGIGQELDYAAEAAAEVGAVGGESACASLRPSA